MTAITSAPVRRRMSRADRASQLLEVAERLIATHGVLATSMDDVADAAGVTKPIVYDHFGSKDGLLCALIARAGSELYEHTNTAVADAGTPLEALERGIRAYFETLDRRDGVWWALLDATAAVSPATLAELDQIRARQSGFITDLIAVEFGDDRARASIYAQAVVGACERLAAARAEHPRRLTVDAVTRHLVELLWCGFEALQAGERASAGTPAPS